MELSDVLTHFGGSLVFDKNAYISHYIICNTVQTSHLIKGYLHIAQFMYRRMANGIEVLSEEDIWECVTKMKRLHAYSKPASKFVDVSSINDIQLYQNIKNEHLLQVHYILNYSCF